MSISSSLAHRLAAEVDVLSRGVAAAAASCLRPWLPRLPGLSRRGGEAEGGAEGSSIRGCSTGWRGALAACACSPFHRVAAGQASSSATASTLRHGWERYSTEVPQRTRTEVAAQGRVRTVTCTDGRGWTCCRQMACKRSAVRARLAPPVQKRNSNGSNSEYSRKVQQRRPLRPPYVCSDRASSPGRGCWQDSEFQALNRRWPACHLRKSPCHRSRDSCRRVTTQPSWTATPASDCCRICKWPGRAGGPVHCQEPRPLARAARSLTAGSAHGRGASRRGCQSGAGPGGALRRSGAGLRCGAALRACRRAGTT